MMCTLLKSLGGLRRRILANRSSTHVGFYRRSNQLNRLHRILTPLVLLVAIASVAGCGNKPKSVPATETAPAAAPAPVPIAQITATPTLISAGDEVQLSWRTTDATSVSIDGIGDVRSEGHTSELQS